MAKLFGWNIFSNKSMQAYNADVQKNLITSAYNQNMRTAGDPKKTMGDEVARIPYYPYQLRYLYDTADYSDVVRTILFNLRKEIFRNGIEIEEKFANKCNDCGKEFEHPKEECDECKSTNLREPDPDQKKVAEKILENANENKQTLIEVSEQLEDDVDKIDDLYLQVVKDYYFNEQGELIGSIPIEIIRADPFFLRIIADRTGRPGRTQDGELIKTCVFHREKFYKDMDRCPSCNCELQTAFFRGEDGYGKFKYYIKGEIKHVSKYSPTLTHGFSPLLSIWMKVSTLMSQDSYLNKYYTKQRQPTGLLFVRTPNMDSLEKAWNWMLDMFKKSPHTIPPIAIEGSEVKGKFVEYINFMNNLQDMQYTEQRNEFKRACGALYGVMPLYQADLSQSGGLNNEGLQVTVTNRAIESGQNIFNDKLYPWLFEQFQITDYRLKLNPSEEKDDMAEEQLFNQRAQNAQLMQTMGFEVTLNEDSEFEFEPTEEPVASPEVASPFGGFGDSPSPKNPGATPAAPAGKPSTPKPRMDGQPETVNMGKGINKKITAEEETEIINENKKKEENQKRHKFEASQWTHPNGHPRCRLCGDEERIGGYCEPDIEKADAPVLSTTSGVNNPLFGRIKRGVKDYMNKQLLDVMKSEGADLPIEKQKEGTEDMATFIARALFDQKFDGVKKSISDIIKEYLVGALNRGATIDTMAKFINRKGGKNMDLNRAEVIARTESQAMRNQVREFAFKKIDPDEEKLYKWQTIKDSRRSDICKNIANRTKDGVKLSALRKIVKEESIKGGSNGSREWTPHVNCRSGFLRAIR